MVRRIILAVVRSFINSTTACYGTRNFAYASGGASDAKVLTPVAEYHASFFPKLLSVFPQTDIAGISCLELRPL